MRKSKLKRIADKRKLAATLLAPLFSLSLSLPLSFSLYQISCSQVSFSAWLDTFFSSLSPFVTSPKATAGGLDDEETSVKETTTTTWAAASAIACKERERERERENQKEEELQVLQAKADHFNTSHLIKLPFFTFVPIFTVLLTFQSYLVSYEVNYISSHDMQGRLSDFIDK